ncbi:hypothetical protein KJ708_14500, partial [bacterium]|nr:hypothetical protein [bacterium]
MIDVITMPSLVGSVGGVQAATAYLDIPSLTGNNPFVYEDRWCSQCASDVKLERLVQKRQGLVHSNLQMRPRQCALLVRRRRETSFGTGSRPLTARLVGASLRQYQVFEDQRETGFDVPFIRGACELFKVRFNFLSYENKPLVDPVSIWNDIVLRCAQMQLSREELIEALRSLGFSYTYESLKVAVFSGKARSEALRGALALLLHTRIWPDNVQGQQITTIDTLIQVVRRLRQEWQMSAAEMAEIFYQEKFTGKEIGNIECGYYKIDHPCVRQLAEGLELSLSKIYTSPDVLPVIEKKQWYDDALIKLITDRCQMLRISAWQLADRIGVSGDPLNKILTGRTTLDGRKFWHSYRNDLELCAAYLKIPLHSIAQLPAEIITVTKQPQDTAEDYATKVLTAVMEMVVKRRKGLAYTINETAILYKEKYGIGIDAASITALEQGTFFVRNAVNKIERLALLFAIDYDPFAFLEPLALDNTIDKAVLATIMRERKKTCPVSSRRLAQIMGVNHRELAGMFTGHYSRRHVKVQDLLICLKIKPDMVYLPISQNFFGY